MEQTIGCLEGIFTTDIAGAEMISQQQVRVNAGVGLEGDRYSTGQGHYSSVWHEDRQATFIAAEALDSINDEFGLDFGPEETRRNFVTRGFVAKDLIGVTFRIGSAVFHGGRENVPCKYLERLIGKPVFDPLVGRSGLNARILESGIVRVGDPIIKLYGGTDA